MALNWPTSIYQIWASNGLCLLSRYGPDLGHMQTIHVELRWPKSSPTSSSGPHTAWNDGTWAVHPCLPDMGQWWYLTGPFLLAIVAPVMACVLLHCSKVLYLHIIDCFGTWNSHKLLDTISLIIL